MNSLPNRWVPVPLTSRWALQPQLGVCSSYSGSRQARAGALEGLAAWSRCGCCRPWLWPGPQGNGAVPCSKPSPSTGALALGTKCLSEEEVVVLRSQDTAASALRQGRSCCSRDRTPAHGTVFLLQGQPPGPTAAEGTPCPLLRLCPARLSGSSPEHRPCLWGQHCPQQLGSGLGLVTRHC